MLLLPAALCAATLFFLPPVLARNPSTTKVSGTEIFKSLTNKKHYYKWKIPPTSDGGPLEVLIRVYIYHLKTKETNILDINMQMLLELTWTDPRLSYNETSTGLRSITGGTPHLDEIWLPVVIFSNEKESDVMGSISKDNFLTILPSGQVILTTRLKTSMYCFLKLGNFPFDRQDCHMSMENWRYNSSLLHLMWDKEIDLQVRGISQSLVEFNILSVTSESTLENRAEISPQLFSSVTIRMKLERSYGYYFLNYYLPSALLVSISWVSFWLEPSAVPGRVVLGTATMLTFIQLCWSAQGIQKVSPFMANDVWALTCTAFIFLSLAEFAFVNTIDRKGAGSKLELKKLSSKYILRGGVDTAAGRAKLRRSSSCPSSPEIRRHFAHRVDDKNKTLKTLQKASNSLAPPTAPKDRRKSWIMPDSPLFTMTPQEIAAWIDAKSKIFFPLGFCIFNVVYWTPLIIVNW